MLRMGLCLGTEVTEEQKKARIHSTRIDRDLYEYAKREMNVVKILLLGETGEEKSPEFTCSVPECITQLHLNTSLDVYQWMT